MYSEYRVNGLPCVCPERHIQDMKESSGEMMT